MKSLRSVAIKFRSVCSASGGLTSGDGESSFNLVSLDIVTFLIFLVEVVGLSYFESRLTSFYFSGVWKSSGVTGLL